MKTLRRQLRPAFTLIELVTVVALISVLAASAIPALRTLRSTRIGAAAAEVRRQLAHARATAVASGRPTGLRIATGSALTQVQIPTVGGAISTLVGSLGEAEPTISLPQLYSGSTISRAQLGTGDSGVVTFWFRFDGTPQTRSTTGALGSAWTSDGEVEIQDGPVIRVRRVTGAIE